ncbi:MAG: hypothetical protein U5K54_10455 [Cytophagales bacterium]|nr:hypothetical protein [Cytophagales bacterium]
MQSDEDNTTFHAGTITQDESDGIVTNGGRVLAATGIGQIINRSHQTHAYKTGFTH